MVVPRVRLSKVPAPTFQPARPAQKGSTKDSGLLRIPKWPYKVAMEEKPEAEEAEKKHQAKAWGLALPRSFCFTHNRLASTPETWSLLTAGREAGRGAQHSPPAFIN
ncbi:ankyrin repeat domain-containing protein 33B-like, partial [Hylobates moloch]|uniref:ankyrin repeat domain-containing protein 33B-like n=1 Tax=Hylobates moloch TaxID=81572 RepID=UPI00267440EA